MADSYWRVDQVAQIGEEKVQIPSENGLSYTSGQKITLDCSSDRGNAWMVNHLILSLM